MIHNVLLKGADHRSDGLFRPETRLKAGTKADKAPDFYTVSYLWEPAPSDVRPFICFATSALGCALCLARTPDMAELRHTMSFKACIS